MAASSGPVDDIPVLALKSDTSVFFWLPTKKIYRQVYKHFKLAKFDLTNFKPQTLAVLSKAEGNDWNMYSLACYNDFFVDGGKVRVSAFKLIGFKERGSKKEVQRVSVEVAERKLDHSHLR
jgi:hypothetical protein